METVHFNPHDPGFLQNPYPVYQRLQAQTPRFFHEETGFWYFTRHEDVSTLLRDRRLGRSITHIMSADELNLPPAPPEYEPFIKLGRHSMFDQEPPDHTRLRSLVHKAFTPARIREMRHSIQAITDELLDRVQANGEMDVLEDFAVPLPVTVIAELLGIPQADRPKLRP